MRQPKHEQPVHAAHGIVGDPCCITMFSNAFVLATPVPALMHDAVSKYDSCNATRKAMTHTDKHNTCNIEQYYTILPKGGGTHVHASIWRIQRERERERESSQPSQIHASAWLTSVLPRLAATGPPPEGAEGMTAMAMEVEAPLRYPTDLPSKSPHICIQTDSKPRNISISAEANPTRW